MLLDTCALLWLASDHSQLSEKILKQIDETAVISLSSIFHAPI